MRVAVAQIVSSTDPRANLALVREVAAQAADAGARLVVFPEATMASFATASAAVAEPLDGPWAAEVRTIAAELGLTIVLGMFETSATPRPYNTMLVTGGGVEAAYRKLHLFDAWGFRESDYITAGDDPVLVEIDGFTVGLALCYDIRFPELFRHYGRQGADIVLVSASWANGPDKAEQWRSLCIARAMDSTCYVVAAAQGDPATEGLPVRPGAPTGVGHSVVVDPLGSVLAEAGDAAELLIVDLVPDAVPDARRKVPVLANARFGLVPPG